MTLGNEAWRLTPSAKSGPTYGIGPGRRAPRTAKECHTCCVPHPPVAMSLYYVSLRLSLQLRASYTAPKFFSCKRNNVISGYHTAQRHVEKFTIFCIFGFYFPILYKVPWVYLNENNVFMYCTIMLRLSQKIAHSRSLWREPARGRSKLSLLSLISDAWTSSTRYP